MLNWIMKSFGLWSEFDMTKCRHLQYVTDEGQWHVMTYRSVDDAARSLALLGIPPGGRWYDINSGLEVCTSGLQERSER